MPLDIDKTRHLLIGPIPPPVGGATVLFRQLVRELAQQNPDRVRVVNTSRRNGMVFNLSQAAIVFARIAKSVRHCDVVSFHTSRRGAALFAPIVYTICLVTRKPWIFRGFGDFETWHKRAGTLQRALFDRTALRANVALFETKSAVQYFTEYGGENVRWYPNNRPFAPAEAPSTRDATLRFVFIGHVKPSKGVRELIAAAKRLRGGTVDVFGPLFDGMRTAEFDGTNISYRGSLEPDMVGPTLLNYDALVLPTYYEGEGYPGIVLEAYAQGLPVIATRWRSIPEIVSERSGILIDPRSVDSLAEAMQQLDGDRERLARLKAGALTVAQELSSSRWTQAFARLATDLT